MLVFDHLNLSNYIPALCRIEKQKHGEEQHMMRICILFSLLQKEGMQKASVIVESVSFFLLPHYYTAESFSSLAKFCKKESHDKEKVCHVRCFLSFSFSPCLIERQLYINMIAVPQKTLFYLPTR